MARFNQESVGKIVSCGMSQCVGDGAEAVLRGTIMYHCDRAIIIAIVQYGANATIGLTHIAGDIDRPEIFW